MHTKLKYYQLLTKSQAQFIDELVNEVADLRSQLTEKEKEIGKLREALTSAEIVMCGVGVPHPGERELLQQGVDIVRAALTTEGDTDCATCRHEEVSPDAEPCVSCSRSPEWSNFEATEGGKGECERCSGTSSEVLYDETGQYYRGERPCPDCTTKPEGEV